MKKTMLACIVGSFISLSAAAQEESGLKPFKVDLSLGYAVPGGKGAKGGILFVVEPKYAVMPNLALGLRLETAVMARASVYDGNGEPADVEVKASGSYVATGDYYFTNNYSFRPFAGAGAGLYRVAAATVNNSGSSTDIGVEATNKFGGLLRAGAEMRHFRLGVEYNLVGKSNYNGYDQNGSVVPMEAKNGYLGIKLGFCIGGGPL